MTPTTTTAAATAARIATEEIMGAVPTDQITELLLDTSYQRGKAWANSSTQQYWVHSDVIVHRPAAAGRTEIQWWLIRPATRDADGEPVELELYGWRVTVLTKDGSRWSSWGRQAAQGVAVSQDKARRAASRVAHALAKQRLETPRCKHCDATGMGQSGFVERDGTDGTSYCNNCGRSQ